LEIIGQKLFEKSRPKIIWKITVKKYLKNNSEIYFEKLTVKKYLKNNGQIYFEK